MTIFSLRGKLVYSLGSQRSLGLLGRLLAAVVGVINAPASPTLVCVCGTRGEEFVYYSKVGAACLTEQQNEGTRIGK